MTTFATRDRRAALRSAAALAVALLALNACTAARDPQPPVPDASTAAPPTTTSSEPGSGLIAPDDDTDTGPVDGGHQSGSGSDGQPRAATLPWLGGTVLDGGVLVDGARWHGRDPGEHAVITDTGYRYFAADGSAVSCVPSGACVGVGADGSVVVVAGKDGPRRVFGADGRDLGLFTADGDPTEGPSTGTDEGDGEASDGEASDGAASDGAASDGDGEMSVGGGDASVSGEATAGGEATGTTAPDGTGEPGSGDIDPDGPDPAADRTPPGDLLAALDASGIDVASLVNEMTLRQPFAGGVTGDPHLITAGGTRYTTQAMGQFLALRDAQGRRIQLEFAPMAHRSDVSIVTATAIDTGSDVITVTAAGAVTIDGRSQIPASSFDQVVLADGVAVGRWPADETGPATVVIWWPDGSEVALRQHPALGMTLIAALPLAGEVEGLFTLPAKDQVRSIDAAVDTWRVTAADRLFDSAAAVNGRGSTPPIDAGAQKVAYQWCSGLTRSQDRSACAFDVAVTGDTSFVAGHLALEAAGEAHLAPGPFAARWPALTAGVRANAEDLPANGRISAPVTENSSVSYHLDLPRPGAVSLSFSAGCAAAANPPGIDEPAVRIFDESGYAVTDRLAWCGQITGPSLPAGSYQLVLANGQGRGPSTATLDVALP